MIQSAPPTASDFGSGSEDPSPAVDVARRRLGRAASRPLVSAWPDKLLPLLAVVVPLTMLGIVGKLSWYEMVQKAGENLGRLADAAAVYGAQTFEGYSIAAGRINDHVAALDGLPPREMSRQAHQIAARLTAEVHQPIIAFVVGGDGYPIAASHLPTVPRVELTDRDYFQALSGPDPPAFHISRMFVGRFDDQLLVAFSRARQRIDAATGQTEFAGLTTISVDPRVIGEGLRRLQITPADRLVLLREDGEVISSSVPHDAPLPAFSIAGEEGVVPPASLLAGDGARRGDVLVAARAVAGSDAYAVASRDMAAVRGEWMAGFAFHLAFGIPATAALFLLSMIVRREQILLRETNAALEVDIERTADRLERAQRFALVGTFEVDLRTGASYRSPEYLALHGLPPTAAREVHADWVKRLHPEDRRSAESRFLEVIADGSGVTQYAQTYRIVTSAGETRWIAARGEVERDADGQAIAMRGVHADVTTLRVAELALQASDARLRLAQEAIGIGNWEWWPARRRILLTGKAQELLGLDDAPAAWRSVLRRILPADRRRVLEQIAAAASQSLRLEFRVRRPEGAGRAGTVWIMARARAMDAEEPAARHLVGVAYDITDRKLGEERAAMLAREVEHRARNLLNLVTSLVRMSDAPTKEELVESLEGRLNSLSRTITLLGRTSWSGTSLRQLLMQELEPFAGEAEGRVVLSGPDVVIGADAAQPLVMAVHELTTNAVKYGSLSVPAGRLHLSWTAGPEGIVLTWQERGGPPVEHPPSQEGFGTVLVSSVVVSQLGGTVEKRWDREGLVCEIAFPSPSGAAAPRAAP